MKIIFLGVQGSGKSTQAKKAAEYLNVPYIEMGQLLRDKTKEENQEGQMIKQALDNGKLVPDEIALNTLHNRLSKSDCENGYVLDGYPRNSAQLQGLPKDIDIVVHVKVSDQEALKRLLSRGRHDDRKELIENRMSWHHKDTQPLLKEFERQGILEEVDGERSIQDISQDIAKIILNEKTPAARTGESIKNESS